MPEYTIKSGKIRKDDKTYFPGDTIELPEEVARVLPQDRLVTLNVTGKPVRIAPPEEAPASDETETPAPDEIETPPIPAAQDPQNENKGNQKKRR